jgi:predicted phosphodiesterase
MTECLTFIHLSDIHFTRRSGDVLDPDDNVRHELLRDVTRALQDVGPVTGVLVTGDIAFSGTSEEYEKAAKWLEELCSQADCPAENVFVVPGNHDVDRRIVETSVTVRAAHKQLRAAPSGDVGAMLRQYCEDTLAPLFESLVDYNSFAGLYGCAITRAKPYWQREFRLTSGPVIRLRGLTSVLVSDSEDARGNIVLGSVQADVQRDEGVEYVTLCHHPPEWLLDHDECTRPLDSKVRVQLFGHKHSPRVLRINDSVRVTAGATHPGRDDRQWVPMFNIIRIGPVGADGLPLRVYARKWHDDGCFFVPDLDPETGREFFEKVWEVPKMTASPEEGSPVGAPDGLAPAGEPATEGPEAPAPGAPPDGLPVTGEGPARRLTYRFLTLPFRRQMEIAQKLDLLTDDDKGRSDSALFIALFRRATRGQKLERLWDETEACHGQTGDPNPFVGR